MMFGASPSMQANEFVATAAGSAADDAEEGALVLEHVPLPPRRPRHLGRTVTANR
jgi:hypothetical protein